MVALSGSSKSVCAWASLAIVLLAVMLDSCTPQSDPQNSTKLVAIQVQLKQIESRLTQLENSNSSSEWVLWLSQENRRYPLNSGYPTAQSAYPTKESCLKAASGWSLPDGNVIAVDPYIIQNTRYQLTYRCLPIGVKPIGKP